MPDITNNSGVDKLEQNQSNYQNSPIPEQDKEFYANKQQQLGQVNLHPQQFNFPGYTPVGNEEQPKKSPIEELADNINKGSGKSHPENDSYISKTLLSEDYSKYPQYYFGMDNEDMSGKSQGAGTKLKNSLVKSIGKFGTTLLDGVIDPVYGTIKAISDGKFSSFYNNDYTKAMDDFNKSMEKNFPNYVSNEEKNASWYSPKHWATTNFLGGIFENAGFMFGIGATAWLTGGVGTAFGEAVGSVVPGLSRAAAMGKWAEAAERLDNIMSTPIPELSRVSTYSEELGKITKATEDVMQAKGAYSKFDVLNKAQRTIYGGISNIGVASSMSLEATNRFRQNLIQNFITKNGYQPDSEDLKQINDTTDKVGGTLFGLTAAMGMMTFHGLFKKVLAKKEGEDILKKEIEDITLQEGDKKLNTIYRTPEQEIKGEGTEYIQDITEKKVPKNFIDKIQAKTGAIGNFAKKYGSKIYDPWGGVGMLEFGTVQPGVENYYKRKYETGHADLFSDALVPGMKSVFTKEGFDALILGGLGAKLPEVVSEKINGTEKKEKFNKAVNTSDAINGLNKAYLSSYLKATTDSIIRGKSLNDSKISAVENGDKRSELTAKSQELYNYLYPRIKFGLKNLVDHDLSIYTELSSTSEGMKQLVDEGIVPKFNDKDFEQVQKDFKEHLKHIQDVADKMDTNQKSLIIRFGNIKDKEGNRLYPDEIIEKMGEALHSTDDASERVKDIIDNHLGELNIIHDIDSNNETNINNNRSIVNDLFQVFNAISNHAPVQEKEITDRIKENITKRLADKNGFLETNKDIKQQYNKYIDDAIALYREKMNYFNEYEDMKQNPSIHKDPNITNPIVDSKENITPNSDKEEGETLNSTVKSITAGGEQEFEVGPKHYISNFISADEINNLGLSKRSDLENLIKSRKDFSIVGKDKSGLNIDLNDNKINIPSKLLEKLHIGREDEKNKTVKSKFYNDHKLEDLSNGLIEYNPTKDSLSFVYQDINDNKLKRLSLDDIFTPAKTFEELKKDIKDLQKTITSDANDYPPVPPEGNNGDYEEFTGSGELKSITNIYDTTEEPAYEDDNSTEFVTQYDKWSKRKNSFENNSNNSEWLKGSDIKSTNDLHMIAIHHDNQDIHGFNNFIPESYSIHGETIMNTGDKKNIERGAIAMITVLKDTDGTFYTLDNKGKKLKKVGDKHTKEDYDKMIFSYRTNASKYRTGLQQKGQSKYHTRHLVESGMSADEITKAESGLLESAINDRKRIFDKKSYEIYTFKTSKGIPNEVYNNNNELVKQHNSIVDNKIVPKQDLGEVGLLNIATQSTDESKYGVIYDSTGIANKFKLGSVVLKYGSDLVLMKSRKFSSNETEHLYKVLRTTAKEMVDNKSVKPSQKYVNYLKSILFFSNQYLDKTSKKVHDSQVFFDNDGNLRLGNTNPIPLVSLLDEFNPFDTDEISNDKPIKKQVSDYFANQYHATNNQLLKENKPYEEIINFDKDGNPEFAHWDSYQHYLLDNQYPSGKKRNGIDIPLTTDIINPVSPYEAPLKQKYNIFSHQPVGENEKELKQTNDKGQSKGQNVSNPTLEVELSSLEKLSDISSNVDYLINNKNEITVHNNALDKTYNLDRTMIDNMKNPELKKEMETILSQYNAIKEKYAKSPEIVKDEKISEASQKDMTTDEVKREYKDYAKELFETKGRVIESKDHEVTLETNKKVTFSTIEKVAEAFKGQWEYGDKIANNQLEPIEHKPLGLRDEEGDDFIDWIHLTQEQYDFAKSNFNNVGILFDAWRKRRDIEEHDDSIYELSPFEEYLNDKIESNKKLVDTAQGDLFGSAEQKVNNQLDEIKKKREQIRKENESNGTDPKRISTKRGESEYKLVSESDKTSLISSTREAEFKEFLSKNIPGVTFEILPHAIKTENGAYAWGAYDHNYRKISVRENSPIGTEYHEAFHAVWSSYLSDKEQDNLYKEFRNRISENATNYTDRFGNSIKYKEATNKDIREAIAEEFSEYQTTGKNWKSEPVKQNFFKRLLNFIKNFIFGKPETISSIFKKMNSTFYADKPIYEKRVVDTEYSETSLDDKVPESWIRQVTDGVVHTSKKFLGISNGQLLKVVDSKLTAGELFDNVFQDLKQFYEHDIYNTEVDGKQLSNETINEVINGKFGWEFIKDNWNDIIQKSIDRYDALKVGFKKVDKDEFAEANQDSEDNATNENNLYKHHYEETDNGNQRDYDRDIFKSNAKKSSPAEIQFLFNTIAKTRNLYGIRNEKLEVPELLYSPLFMEQLVEGNRMFYKTLSSLANKDGLWNLRDAFKELATTTPELVRIYKALFEKDFKNLNEDQWRMIMKFQKSFSKQRPQSPMWIMDEMYNSYGMDANSEKDSDNIIKNWWSSFKANKSLSSFSRGGNYIINRSLKLIEPKSDTDILKFFDQINFPINEELIGKIPKTKEGDKIINEIRKNALSLYVQLNKGIRIETRTTSKGVKAETSIKRLAEVIAKLNGNEDESQYARVDGEYVQTNVLHNFMSRTMAAINQAKNISNFYTRFPNVKNDVISKHSIWLTPGHEGSWYDKDGNLRQQIIPQVDGGLRNIKDGVISADMNRVTRGLHMLNKNLGSRGRSFFNNIVPGDSKSEFGMALENVVSVSRMINGTYKPFVENIFKGYLEDEIGLIRDKDRRLDYKVMQGKADKLRFFKNILNKDLVDKIQEFANDSSKNEKTLEDFFTDDISENREQIFKDQMWNWINKEVDDEFINYRDNKLIEYKNINKQDKFFFYGLSTDFVKEFNSSQAKKDDKYLFAEKDIKDILKYRLMNLMIHNIELHKVFFGDPAFSKDASKRRKLENSGTESTHTDDGEVNGLNNFLNKEWNKSNDIQLEKNDWGYYDHSDIMKKFTFKHGDSNNTMIVSDIANELQELANEPNSEFSKEAADKYEKVNGIDAQAYTLIGFHREFGMKNGGEPNDDYKKQFEYWEAKERIALDLMLSANKDQVKKWTGRDFIYSNDSHGKDLKQTDQQIIEKGNPEIKGSFYVRKNMSAGPIERNDMNVPNKNKMSELSLFWGLFADENNNVIRPQMADFYFFMKRNNIKYAGPESQQKEGALEGNPDLYDNATGKIKLDDSNLNKVYSQNLRYHNKIVENASMHDSQKMGTQQRVLSTMDWFGNGLPRDFYSPKENDYTKNINTKLDEWNKLSEIEKNEKSEMYKLYNDITNTLNHFFERKFQNALDRLGLKDFGEQNYKLIDPEKVVNFLKDASKIYELPDNVKNAIKTTYNPDTQEGEVILDYLPNRGALESMIYSIIEKELIRPEMSGGSKVLVSGEMFEKGNRESVYRNGNKWEKVDDYNKLSDEQRKTVRLTSNSYKIYKRGEIIDGKRQKTSLMQVGLPNHFREEIKKWAKRTGKTMKSDTEILEYLNNSEEGKKLLHGVGFRIPTQGLNSIDAFEIVEFLPQELGDVIVVPAEITTKVGSDFDIDKLNTYMHNFFIDKNGFPSRVEFITDTQSDAGLKKLYNANYSSEERSYTKGDKLLNEYFGIDTPSLEEYIKENRGKNPYSLNSEKALQNKYFEQLEDSVTLPDNYERLMTPNSSDEMKEIEEYVTKIRNKGITEKASDINYTNQLNPQWIINERQTFLDSKSQVGTPAMNNVSHAISQTNPIYINTDKSKINPKDIKYLGKDAVNKFDFNIRLPHNKISVKGQEYTSLSGLVNNKKMYISDILSQVINGAVDAASDPWLSRLLQSRSLLSVSLFLERSGVDIDHSQLFLNQPIIDEYLRENDAQRYTAAINPDMNWLFRDKLIEKVKNLKGVFTGSRTTLIPDEFKLSDLKDMFETYHLKGADKLTSDQRALQKHILDEFIKYQMFSGDLFQMQQGTYWGNLRKPNDITIDLKNIMLEYHDQNGIIKGGKENMDNGFMGTIREKAIQLSKAASTIFKLSSPNAKRVIDPIKKIFGNPLLKVPMENRVTSITKAKDSLLDYLVQNTNFYNNEPINNYIEEFLLDKDSAITNLLLEVQKVLNSSELKNSNLSDNLAIKKLAASLKDNIKNIKNIQLDNKPTDVFTANSLTKALAELRDSGFIPARELYHKLIITGMLQSGIRDSRTSFNKFIPYTDYVNILKPAIHSIDKNSDLLQSFLNTDAYYRNNWMDDTIVPKVKMRTNYMTGEEYYPYYNDANLQKVFGTNYNFLSLHEWSNNSKYPVVKITEPKFGPDDMVKYKNEGYTYDQLYKTVLFRKVEQHLIMSDGEIISTPIATKLNAEGVAETLYKPINAWGRGNELQEHYTNVRPSVLESNEHINEFADEDIISAFMGAEIPNEEIDESIPWEEETFKQSQLENNYINFKRGDKIKFYYNDHYQEGNITAPFYDNKGNKIGVIVDGKKEILFKNINNENNKFEDKKLDKNDEPNNPC